MTAKKWELQEQIRLDGVERLHAGASPTEVARELGVSRLTVYNWKARGTGKSARIRPCGRKAKLTIHQRAILERILERGAVAYGFTTEVWTGERICRVLQERFGVRYHPKFVPWLLRSWGWSWQKPARQARERNEQAIAEWVHREWPRIKKTSGAGMPA
jgi:transposase